MKWALFIFFFFVRFLVATSTISMKWNENDENELIEELWWITKLSFVWIQNAVFCWSNLNAPAFIDELPFIVFSRKNTKIKLRQYRAFVWNAINGVNFAIEDHDHDKDFVWFRLI